ncbi:SepM family pheromone-processing serine protease [Paenibacillus sp. JSM ZJ436]|uniref:SepM family pheromone-processing serine protease n=1 Tax=Paenibacillus sp. JSM ZJ436 TaxID=3376190 RepID=UPI0037888D67
MNRTRNSSGMRVAAYLLLVAVMVYVIVYMPTPYMIYQPGSAEEIKPMISVNGGDSEEQGAFMLTTVSASYANIALLAWSAVNPNSEVVQKEQKLGDQSKEEYSATQIYYMNTSQSLAVEAAYTAAGIPYNIVPDYMFIRSVPDTYGSEAYFRPGDKLMKVNGTAVYDHEALTKIIRTLQAGDRIQVQLERSGKPLEVTLPLVEITDSATGEKRPGLGVLIATMQTIQPDHPDHKVAFSATNIGGPSAGLMFTMEIYNQLTPGDLTKGYVAAGTGTITKEGTVGPIGGIVHKIVAADREGAEIFFVPRQNFEDAKSRADQIGTGMKLVPVEKLQDALDYMESLPLKAAAGA